MIRSLGVIALAVLMAVVTGLSDTSWAAQVPDAQSREAQRQAIARRLAEIERGTVVRIDRTDGTRLNAVLLDVTPDAITVRPLDAAAADTRSIPIDEIARVDRVRGRALRKVLIAAGVVAAVLVGTCAVALSSNSTQPRARPGEPLPSRDIPSTYTAWPDSVSSASPPE
jgi:hypothetical protein